MLNALSLSANNFMDDAEMCLSEDNYETVLFFIKKYNNLLRSRAASYVTSGCEFDDLMQEAVIALISAIRAFNPTLSKFNTFATVCIDRSLISYVKKNSKSVCFEDIDNTPDIFDGNLSPEDLYFVRDEFRSFMVVFHKLLSKLEFDVYVYLLYGYSYSEVSNKLKINEKIVNNAAHRARKKVKNYLENMPK